MEEYIQIQNRLRDKICIQSLDREIKTVAGVDLAYWGDNNAVCCIVVLDYNTHEVLEKEWYAGKVDFPYISGLLAFRELPLILETIKKLKVEPDLYMFDGNGILHPRNMGIATHASFYVNKPTIGVAKSYCFYEPCAEPDKSFGSYVDIEKDGVVYGRCLRTRTNVKPVFVSVGNYITLQESCDIVLNFIESDSRIPLPTRYADIETHIMRKNLGG